VRAVKSVTVVVPAYQVTGAMASTVRDQAVATSALRSRGIDLDVLLLHDGQDDVAAISTRAADDLGLSLTTLPGSPTGSGAAHLEGFRRVIEEDRADLVATLDANGRHDPTQLPHLIDQLVAEYAGELRLAARALRPGGALLVFGPALGWMYSELDYKAGHYRRYSLRRLRRLAADAGLEVVSARYFDLLGVAPYALVYRLLRHDDITGSTLWGYDRVVVPASRWLQRLLRHPPLGKNVILIARKP
jgi:hypothetical protein